MESRYETVIGLEVHAQLLTRSKAFCGCSAAFGAAPNSHVCPVCLGLPGALPVLNADAVKMAVRAALALECKIVTRSRFARKNYFYPDLPKGYQISQFDEPFSQGGTLEFDLPVSDKSAPERARKRKRAGITRIHMEEDAGKNLHDRGDNSIVDLNRSGVPLIEIVGEPDLRSAVEAAEYLKALREVLMFIGVNDGNLEEGSFRCDANVSIRPRGQEKFGTRAELKNINSFRFVQKAIEYEIQRQETVLESGGKVVQETRGWDEKSGQTFSMRSKEEAQDYRYFPDPDLPPLILDAALIDEVRRTTPELPAAKRTRFVRDLGLTAQAAEVLCQHPRVASFFEETVALHGDPIKIGNFVQSEVLRDVTTRGLAADLPISPTQLAELLKLVDTKTISGKQAKEVYVKLQKTDAMPATVVADLGMVQISDVDTIERIARELLEKNPKQVEAVRQGKLGILGFFVGGIMKATQGSANPAVVNDVLKRLLGLP